VTACRCQFCHDRLEPAQELRFLVEIQNLDNPAYLEHIRRLPAVNGKPLRVCKPCQAKVEAHPNRLRAVSAARPPLPSGLLAACGLLSVGLVLFTLLGGGAKA
jgi:hypothetical protein